MLYFYLPEKGDMSRELRKNILKSAKRVVIKVGSGVISDHESGKAPLERGLSQKRIRSYLNIRHTLEALLAHGVIPIVNENDSVTVDEIKIGDNDTLSANVACMAEAHLLILLSDVDGLFTSDPSRANNKSRTTPELIPHVDRITSKIEKLAGKSKNPLAVGGMYTKVLAAKKTMSYGIPTLIINGLKGENLKKVFAGSQVGTLFWSGEAKIKDRKHWIAHTLKPAGSVEIDAGARKALVERGKSLLAAGVVTVDGKFEFGAAVRILDEKGREIARGLVNYNSRDLDQIKGMKTAAVRSLVGSNFYEEVIHRDDLVLM